jgi:hypothetical protein
VKQKILAALFLRFVPHRTAIGIALFLASQAVQAFTSEAACGDMPSVCAAAAKAGTFLAPWFIAAGIRDKDRN